MQPVSWEYWACVAASMFWNCATAALRRPRSSPTDAIAAGVSATLTVRGALGEGGSAQPAATSKESEPTRHESARVCIDNSFIEIHPPRREFSRPMAGGGEREFAIPIEASPR